MTTRWTCLRFVCQGMLVQTTTATIIGILFNRQTRVLKVHIVRAYFSTLFAVPISCSIHWHANNFCYHLQNLDSGQYMQSTIRLHTLHQAHDVTAAGLINHWISCLHLHRIHLQVFALNKPERDYGLPGVQEMPLADISTDIMMLCLWNLDRLCRLVQRSTTVAMRGCHHRDLAKFCRPINYTHWRISIANRTVPLIWIFGGLLTISHVDQTVDRGANNMDIDAPFRYRSSSPNGSHGSQLVRAIEEDARWGLWIALPSRIRPRLSSQLITKEELASTAPRTLSSRSGRLSPVTASMTLLPASESASTSADQTHTLTEILRQTLSSTRSDNKQLAHQLSDS